MSDPIRQVLQVAAPERIERPDMEALWRRGRQRRKASRASAALLCAGLVVAAGWMIQSLNLPAGLEVVATPEPGVGEGLRMHPDAVWRAPANGAHEAVASFAAAALGWPSNQLIIDGVSDTPGPMFVTAAHLADGLEISMLVAPAGEGLWQIIQVHSAGMTGGGISLDQIDIPMPAQAATMTVHAWVDGRSVHLRGAARPTIAVSELGADHPDMFGGMLVIYRDGQGRVVGVHGGQVGLGGEQPLEPSPSPPGSG